MCCPPAAWVRTSSAMNIGREKYTLSFGSQDYYRRSDLRPDLEESERPVSKRERVFCQKDWGVANAGLGRTEDP